MAFKLMCLVLLVGALFWAYQNGVLDSISSGNVPKIGKEVKLVGPAKGAGVPIGGDRELISRSIDAHLGTQSDKLAGAMTMATLFRSGELVKLPDNTKARVAEIDTVRVQSMPFKVVRVKILSGSNKGASGWVERDNVIDTPLQELFQAFRSPPKTKGKRDIGGSIMPLSTGME